MSDLAHLLYQLLAARNLPAAVADGHGCLTFYADEDLVVGAELTLEGGLELFTNPGYLSQTQLAALAEDEEDDDDPGFLMGWESQGAQWSLRADLGCGLVVLSQTIPDLPRDAQALAAVLDTMREATAEWSARLTGELPASASQGRGFA